MGLHYRNGPAPLQAGGDLQHAQLFVGSICAQDVATPYPYLLTRPAHQEDEIIPAQPPPPAEECRRDDVKFQTLKNLKLAPPNLKRTPRSLWMSPDSIRLIDKRAALRRNPCHIRNVAKGITRAVRRPLTEDSPRRAEEIATEI